MASSYELILTNPQGEKLVELPKYVSCEYARKHNDIGSLVLVLPANEYDISLFVVGRELRVDNRIEVWRKANEHSPLYMDMETPWFIRKFTKRTSMDGEKIYIIEAVDSIEILDRRIIPYNEGNEDLTADKVDYADDMIKEIMDENFGAAAADANRDLSDWILIDDPLSLAPSIRKSFSRKNVLTTFKEIAESSYEQGTPLVFDLVYFPDSKLFMLRTYTDQRGVDRTVTSGINPLVVGLQYGTTADIEIEYNHMDSRNYIYAGGQAVGLIRAVSEASDDLDIARSPFNRRELFVNKSDTDDADELEDEAEHAVQENRWKINFSGTLVNISSAQYGIDYKYGDKITVEDENDRYDVFIDACSVKIDKNGEDVAIALRSSF